MEQDRTGGRRAEGRGRDAPLRNFVGPPLPLVFNARDGGVTLEQSP